MGDVLDVVHERHAQRVIFGVGSARTRFADEVQRPNDARIRLGAGDAERAVTERPVDRESAKELLRGAWAGWSVLRGHGHRGRGDDLDT